MLPVIASPTPPSARHWRLIHTALLGSKALMVRYATNTRADDMSDDDDNDGDDSDMQQQQQQHARVRRNGGRQDDEFDADDFF